MVHMNAMVRAGLHKQVRRTRALKCAVKTYIKLALHVAVYVLALFVTLLQQPGHRSLALLSPHTRRGQGLGFWDLAIHPLRQR